MIKNKDKNDTINFYKKSLYKRVNNGSKEEKYQEETRQWEANYKEYQEERDVKAIVITIAFVLAIVYIGTLFL